jgi:hypothetical protein
MKKPDNPVKGTLPYMDGISIFFDDMLDKKCRHIYIARDEALEIARKIIGYFGEKQNA